MVNNFLFHDLTGEVCCQPQERMGWATVSARLLFAILNPNTTEIRLRLKQTHAHHKYRSTTAASGPPKFQPPMMSRASVNAMIPPPAMSSSPITSPPASSTSTQAQPPSLGMDSENDDAENGTADEGARARVFSGDATNGW